MMEDNKYVQLVTDQQNARKAGRPRTIPSKLESIIVYLYKKGYGYRAIARVLKNDYHVNPDFSAVKRTLKRLGILPHHGSVSKS
jgi:hypothetical protein